MTTAQVEAPKPHVTEDAFMRLPRDGRKYELVDGRIQEVPASYEHDAVGALIIYYLMSQLRERGAMTTGQTGFRMANGNVRIPDVSFNRTERLPGGKPPREFGSSAPGLCVEVISPSEEPAQMRQKLEDYFASGAQLVWHVFPERRQVIVYTSLVEFITLSENDELSDDEVLPGFSCRVADILVRPDP